MITDKEAKNIAAKIRRGSDTLAERGAYDRWSRVSKGRRPRTTLAELLTEQRARKAATDLLDNRARATAERMIPSATVDGPGFDAPSYPEAYVREARESFGEKKEPPIAPPLPPLDGELIEPIAPPVDLGADLPPGFDLGGGAVKGVRFFLEKQDAKNPELGGVSLAALLDRQGAKFWDAWEAAAERMMAEHVGVLKVADHELVVAGAAAVVAQPIAIPIVKEHGASWLAAIKRKFGFGEAS